MGGWQKGIDASEKSKLRIVWSKLDGCDRKQTDIDTQLGWPQVQLSQNNLRG